MSVPASSRRRIDAIVIGASAGGLDALSLLLPAIPVTPRIAVFVVLHQPRDRRSLLVEIFEPRCALAVREPEDKEPVAPGTIYFAPPDYHLLVDDGPRLSLSTDDPVNYSRPSIDVLFESAADAYGEGLLGIVLSGANDDGADGLAAVHAAGGECVVQDPETAQVSAMPAAALARTPAARVLTLEEIAGLLRGLERRGV